MPSLHCHVALLLSFVGPAAAARLVEQNLLLVATSNVGNLSKGEDLVDLDAYLQQSDVAAKIETQQIKCCCDKYGSWWFHKVSAAYHYDVKERTERCALFDGKGTFFKCGDVPKPAWAALDLSSAARAEQHCKVHKDSIKKVYQNLGSPTKYCSAVALPMEAGHLEPTVVKLGEKFQVKCDTSYEPEKNEVECVYDSASAGKLAEQPKCKMVIHCAETSRTSLMGDPKVAPAGLGLAGEVSCGERGFRPREGVKPICQENGDFLPTPLCEKQPEYCKAGTISGPGNPTVPATWLDDTVSVECEPGWESHERPRCNVEGEFEPPPQCSKVMAYCQTKKGDDLEGAPQFMSAMVDEPVKVWCSQNGYMNTEHADAITCGKDGQPVFDKDQPLCKKTPAFCVFADLTAEGRLALSSDQAELGQTVQVKCNAAGWEPAAKETTCDQWGEFDPEPECQKIEGFCPMAAPNSLGSPSAPAAKVGESVDVDCGDSNFEPVELKATCGPDGELSPEPKCQEVAAELAAALPLCPSSIWSYCSEADLKDGGVACVSAVDAEVQDASEVQCVPKKNNQDGGYQCPAHLSVKCEPFE